ncbi:unnamed protein product, partial [Mesorhabditis spiculigera]
MLFKSAYLMLSLLSLISTVSSGTASIQALVDCDAEWANQVLDVVVAKERDPMRIRHIHAILQSCNKAQLQKVAEISVFLFEKNTYPNPQLMQEIRRLSESTREERLRRVLALKSQLPEHLHQPLGQLATIWVNGALSSNEKSALMGRSLGNLDEEDRAQLENALASATETTKPARIQYGPSPRLSAVAQEHVEVEAPRPDAKAPSPFGGFGSLEHFVAPPGPQPHIVGTSGEQLPAEVLREIAENQNQKNSLVPAKQHSSAELPANADDADEEKPLFRSHRPFSVGSVAKELGPIIPVEVHTEAPPNIPDPDLLTTKPSVWRDAARLLQEGTNIPSRIGRLIDQAVRHPDQLANQLQHVAKGAEAEEERRSWLPARRSDQPPIVPVNQAPSSQISLDRLDTAVDRFSSTGPANRFVLGGQPQLGLGGIPSALPFQPFPSQPSGMMGMPGLGGAAFGLPVGQQIPDTMPGTPFWMANQMGQAGGLQQSTLGMPGALIPGVLFPSQPNVNTAGAATSLVNTQQYTFPIERGQKYLQNLPSWSPMPQPNVGVDQQTPFRVLGSKTLSVDKKPPAFQAQSLDRVNTNDPRWKNGERPPLVDLPDRKPPKEASRRLDPGIESLTGSFRLRNTPPDSGHYGPHRFVSVDINPTESVVG